MASLSTSIPILALVFLLFTSSQARDLLVGGKENAWKIPESSKETLNHWAEKTRFNVGDFLVWKYDGKTDSVLQVTKEDYEKCNISKPVKDYKDGDTKVELDHSGLFFFISGAEGHCEKGEKLVVAVMSEKHGHSPTGNDTQTPVEAPSPAPATGQAGGAHGFRDGPLGYFGSLVIGFVLVLVLVLA